MTDRGLGSARLAGAMLCSALLAWLLLSACGAGVGADSPASSVERNETGQPAAAPRGIGLVLADHEAGEDEQLVVLSGTFRGWKGSCPGRPPVTRSDWMLEDEGGCIYVSGPLPPGLDSLRPRAESLTVRGRLLTDRGGRVYLKAEDVSIN